ncbi:hypothetical protein Btru_026938 [Bulinus truncatus]|nr:hypothetical protein Btru_026938 [Bulinus truncatus]
MTNISLFTTIELTKPCRDYGQCGPNAECGVDRSRDVNVRGSYYASSNGVVNLAISLGEVCRPGRSVSTRQSVSPASVLAVMDFTNTVINVFCFPYPRGYCTRSRNVGEFCFSTDECTSNAHCSADHVCVCATGSANADGEECIGHRSVCDLINKYKERSL